MENVLQQKAKSQQLLNSLHQKPLAPSYPLSELQVELVNMDSIYTSYKPLIITATQLLRRKPLFNGMPTLNGHAKRGLLPFLGLTGTAITKGIKDIKRKVNQLIETKLNNKTL